MGNNIQDFFLRCKSFLEDALVDWGLYAIIFLACLSSFGLGRFSALESVLPPISITEAPTLTKPQGIYPGGLYVASRTGSVYYYPWCAGGGNIPPEQQIWFQSPEEAQSAGYQPAKNCKGL
jgi:hypothetical protein